MQRHQCAAENCPASVPNGVLMCRDHWFQVPAPLRKEIYRTWNDYRASATMETLRAYNATVKDAVAAVGMP